MTSSLDRKGFSLIELLITVGLVSGVALGLGTFIEATQRNQKQLNQKNTLIGLGTDLERAFKSYPTSCGCMFQSGLKPAANTPTGEKVLENISTLLGTTDQPITLKTSALNFALYNQGCAPNTAAQIVKDGKMVGYSDMEIKSASLSAPVAIEGSKFAVDLILSFQSVNQDSMALKPVIVSRILVSQKNGQFTCYKSNDLLSGITCPTGNALIGFSESGDPVCQPIKSALANARCPASQALAGFDSLGNQICMPVQVAYVAPAPVPVPVPTPVPTPVYIPAPVPTPVTTPTLPTYQNVSGMTCAGSGDTKFIIDEYRAHGRCADNAGSAYWVSDYYGRVGRGVPVWTAITDIQSAMGPGFSGESDASLSSFCADPTNYIFKKGSAAALSSQCTIRCNAPASPNQPGCTS